MPKRRSRTPQESFDTWIFEIVEWCPNYSFGISGNRASDGLYLEFARLEITATCIFPKTLEGLPSEINVAGDRRILTPEILNSDSKWKPNGVGALTQNINGLELYVFIPYDAIAGLVSAMATGRWRYLVTHGPSIRRRKGVCYSLSFEHDVNLDEF